jgi:hypothetical protein
MSDPQVDRMSLIERCWTITTGYADVDKRGVPFSVAATVRGPKQEEPIEVVPAEQLRGAVEALERIAALPVTSGPMGRAYADPRAIAADALTHLGGQ